MNKILITGCAGFIGSHLSEFLLARNHEVIGYDNLDPFYPRVLKEANLQQSRKSPSFTFVEGDIRDSAAIEKVLMEHKPGTVIHLAARAGVRPSLEQPELYAQVNIDATVQLLELCRKLNIQRIVFASSSSVYGDRDGGPFRESDNTDYPLSPYGSTKKAGEVITHVYSHLYGFSIACLRFFTVYGPRQRPDLAIRKFVHRALQGKPIPVFGDGSSRRDYTHVSDIVGGINGAINWVNQSSGRYGIFNLGSSSPIELRELLQGIEAGVGPLKIDYLPRQPGDVFQTFADTSLAERELGFRHDVRFEDGLADFIEWMKQHDR
ncbi:MAG: GDP-mannose 4,6-dehydratase [Calditrichaeota bacterium]|nr:GDP-mannose 4,6-dehydratase [Calditrichota bacterium]MCB9366332.1 GDP-mannose 4,6-dehydratase [Calditrichota bacterium]